MEDLDEAQNTTSKRKSSNTKFQNTEYRFEI